jgi:hypothetical protein
MKIRAGLVFSAVLLTSIASAQPPPAPPEKLPPTPPSNKGAAPPGAAPISNVGIVFRAPPDLGQKKNTSFNAALTRAGLGGFTLQTTAPPAYAKLTPAAPSTTGAKITRVGSSSYIAWLAEAPDGIYFVEAAPAPPPPGPAFPQLVPPVPQPVPKGTLEIEFSAEQNKLYFVDCKIAPWYGLPGASVPPGTTLPGTTPGVVAFARSGVTTTQDVSPEDGHYIYAFRTGTGVFLRQTVTLTFKSSSQFFGCEITKS